MARFEFPPKDRLTIGVVGLGYVGLPVATSFAKKYQVVGFDIDPTRISQLKKGYDKNGEIAAKEIMIQSLQFYDQPQLLKECHFIVIAVPTPVNQAKNPDLSPVEEAATLVGKNLSPNSIVVLESTVYPGVTEEIVVPILERESNLVYGQEFKVGYSGERINPGDKEHTLEKISKVVSGSDKEALTIIAELYGSIVKAGVYQAPSIKTAEAAKVIENIQRDLNIALMNEFKVIFDRIGIEIEEVLKAARTKWNFIDFHPGLVGGHCIGVDPYYLAYRAKTAGIHPEIILAGRRVNDEMVRYHVNCILKEMIRKNINVKEAKVLILGATFKPNVRDLRNSKVKELVEELMAFGCGVDIFDPLLDDSDFIYGCRNLKSISEDGLGKYDFVVKAVAHHALSDIKLDYQI